MMLSFAEAVLPAASVAVTAIVLIPLAIPVIVQRHVVAVLYDIVPMIADVSTLTATAAPSSRVPLMVTWVFFSAT